MTTETKTATTQATLVESRTVTRDYEMRGTQAIVDHPKHGRLLLEDGFGGMHSLRGGMVRWEHGAAYRLLSDDTLASLEAAESNYMVCANLLHEVTHGECELRPMLDWSGKAIASLAESVGL